MCPAAREIITALRLAPLPGEGGFFRQTWRDAHGSAIYFLLTPDDFSAWHRLRQTEVWHFYGGDAVEHVQLGTAGFVQTRLGSDVRNGDVAQLIVPAGTWQGAHSAIGRVPDSRSDGGEGEAARATLPSCYGWSLMGCTLAPAWREGDFELADRDTLQRAFPGHAEIIRALTR